MSERRRALLGKFQAAALERLRRISLAVIELGTERADATHLEEVARELHTLKGEANMLRLPEIASVAHAAEGLLGARGSRALPGPEARALLLRASDTLTKTIRDDFEGAGASAELAALRELIKPPEHEAHAEVESGVSGAAHAGAAEADEAWVAPPSTAPAVAPAAEKVDRAEKGAVRWVQIQAGRIDDLCDRASDFAAEFRTLYARLGTLVKTSPLADARGAKQRVVSEAVLRALLEDFDRCRTRLDDVTGGAWSLRLASVEPTLGELARHAYELALGQGKSLRAVVRGGGAEVERSVLDELWEPLVHLVRNAVDHGIERPDERGNKPAEAVLTLEAHPVGAYAVITIRDDGRGIDLDAVRAAAIERGLAEAEHASAVAEADLLEMLFLHGFSTRAAVSEVSGRGVGLDVVRRKVEALGGSVALTSTAGRGTEFTLTVPATISKERALVVECAGALFALPSRHVVEVVRVSESKVEKAASGMVLRYRGEVVPMRSFGGVVTRAREAEEPWAIVVDWGGRHWAFTIPSLAGEHELVRRPVDPLVATLGHVAASAIHDDGRLILLLLVSELIRLADSRGAELAPVARRPTVHKARRRVLVVDDSAITGDLVAEILANAGYDVELALDGQAALARIEARLPDLVLSDIDMPVMNGFELLKRIRARLPHLPVVMLSTRASADDRRQASSLGANAYIVKSAFHESTLVDTIRRFVGEAA